MLAEDLVKQALLPEALAALQEAVRKDAANAKLRVFLFQLLCVMGDWKRAHDQLGVASQIDAKNLLMAQVYRPAIMCELLRAEVFEGKRSPMILGEPEPWIGWMVQACALTARGSHAAADELRSRALEDAPAVSGTIDDRPFAWIMDADSRLGPCLEVILDGKYYWVPWSRVREIAIEAPTDLRDTVWIPAIVTLATDAAKPALLPVRYPGSERSDEGAVRMSRRTDFSEPMPGTCLALGQRVFATDTDDVPLLTVRRIALDVALDGPGPGTASEGGAGG